MHSKSSLFALGLLASTCLSTPTEPKKKGFSISARRAKTSLQQLRSRDDDSVPATRHVVVDFTFGGQPIPVALDSGSTFTYVASTLDKNQTETSSLPTLFNPNASSSYHDENDPADAYDCGGDATTCVMGLDDVATAGLTAKQMAFGVASHVAPGVFSSGQAATMGFGRQKGDDPTAWLPRDQPFWYRAGGDLPLPYLFAADLYADRDGTFDFGFLDSAKYRGDIQYAAVDTSRTNWNFNMTGFAIGNGSVQTASEFTGVVDTGGPNIGLPREIVSAYFDSFGGSPSPGNSHVYPCDAYPPPDLTLQMAGGGGGLLVLNGSFLVTPPHRGQTGMCNGRLDDSEQTAYNLGASVLDQKFVVFDHANQRVGFADKASLNGPNERNTSSSQVMPTKTSKRNDKTETAEGTTAVATATGGKMTTAAISGTSPTSSTNGAVKENSGIIGSLLLFLYMCV